MRKLVLFFILFIFIASTSNVSADYQPKEPRFISLESISTQSPTPQLPPCYSCTSEINDVFLERTIKHEELVDGDIQRFFDLVDRLIGLGKWLLGGSIITAFAAFFQILRKATKAAEEAVATEVDTQLKEMDLTPHIEKSTNQIVNTKFGQRKSIAVYSPKKYGYEQVAKVLLHLDNAGFKNHYHIDNLKDINEAELIIFIYQPALESSLKRLLNKLLKQDSSLPIIVYTRRFADALREVPYEFATAANSLLTLTSWTLTILGTTKSKER